MVLTINNIIETRVPVYDIVSRVESKKRYFMCSCHFQRRQTSTKARLKNSDYAVPRLVAVRLRRPHHTRSGTNVFRGCTRKDWFCRFGFRGTPRTVGSRGCLRKNGSRRLLWTDGSRGLPRTDGSRQRSAKNKIRRLPMTTRRLHRRTAKESTQPFVKTFGRSVWCCPNIRQKTICWCLTRTELCNRTWLFIDRFKNRNNGEIGIIHQRRGWDLHNL